MIVIDLTEDWRIQSDDSSWALAQKISEKVSEKYPEGYRYKMRSWHRTLSEAGKYFVDQELRKSDATGAPQAAQRHDRLKALVDHALEPFGAQIDADASLRKHESP